jgi:N-formylglutamate deformylase
MSDERERLLDRWYRPRHQRLAAAVDRVLERRGRCLLIDAHSFPSSPLPYELDQELRRPDICIGTDPFHTPPALVAFAASVVGDLGWTAGVDRPFSGALVPMPYYGADRRVSAIMIEVNRRRYLDEPIGGASSDFEGCRNLVQRLVHEIINAAAVGRT